MRAVINRMRNSPLSEVNPVEEIPALDEDPTPLEGSGSKPTMAIKVWLLE